MKWKNYGSQYQTAQHNEALYFCMIQKFSSNPEDQLNIQWD